MGIELNDAQRAMLDGERGPARQMAMRLVLDMAAAAGAAELIPIASAHISGVSPLTGGLGLRTFLARLAADEEVEMAVPTTLNAAGCDSEHFAEMRIAAPNFLEHNNEIVSRYAALGIRPTMSCIPYEWSGVVTEGVAAWAESNAICFGNSYCGLLTNRESGLSALAAAITGYTPRYGLLQPGATAPNLLVDVEAALSDPTDFSILGDWIGMQKDPSWRLPYGPIPVLRGLPADLSHEQRKALTAAAANYGCPLLYIEGISDEIPAVERYQATLRFTDADLAERYGALRPNRPVSIIVLGCPQASVGELRAIARRLRGRTVSKAPGGDHPPLWVFTSSANREIARELGVADIIEASGALLLADTCPEVVPYDQRWVKHVLTNSLKAEHYIKSGLNGIPTSVMNLDDCIGVATGDVTITPAAEKSDAGAEAGAGQRSAAPVAAPPPRRSAPFQSEGEGLPSQGDFTVRGPAFVTDTPITFLGFVNRESGVVEEEGHPADGESLAGTIAIFPKGSGSTVAPYVVLELIYRGRAPLAIVNTEIDQQSVPACSLEQLPYAYGFAEDVIGEINHGDVVELRRRGDRVTLRVVERVV